MGQNFSSCCEKYRYSPLNIQNNLLHKPYVCWGGKGDVLPAGATCPSGLSWHVCAFQESNCKITFRCQGAGMGDCGVVPVSYFCALVEVVAAAC